MWILFAIIVAAFPQLVLLPLALVLGLTVVACIIAFLVGVPAILIYVIVSVLYSWIKNLWKTK